MAGFDDVQFPPKISWGSSGGPMWSTNVVALRSGAEARNGNYSAPRHRYDVSKGIQTTDDMATTRAFFFARRGKLYGFRYKDWADFRSSTDGSYRGTVSATDQVLGTINKTGAAQTFQLVKTYGDAARTYSRPITRPVSGTVRISIDNVEKLAADANYPWSVSLTTGVVTITPAGLSAGTATVRAGFEFDVPARFDVDELDVTLETWNTNSAEIPVVEIREC